MKQAFFIFIFFIFSFAAKAQLRLPPKPADSTARISIIAPNFYASHLSFFCAKELKLQKLTNKNIFIRLGSKNYVDYLERKPNTQFTGKQ